jgi:tetratricopeptide (TPR) repeat protein
MSEQLSLFGDENTLYNTGLGQLLALDYSRSLETLSRYHKLFPWGRDVSRDMAIAGFWLEKLGRADRTDMDATEAERRYRLWLEFEETFGYPWGEDRFEEKLQVEYFSRIANSLSWNPGGWAAKLPGGTPIGLLYLLSGRADAAIVSLQELIAAEPENGGFYGYLGDAYTLRGDLRTARICYREAFVFGPHQVDVKRLRDRELKERLAELKEDGSVDGDPLAWFSVVAHFEGFFEPRIFRNLEELKQWLQQYIALDKAYRKEGNQALVPRLFYHAMVLSDNAPMMRFIKKVDLVEVRKRMKEHHPVLFARYMRALEKKDVRSRGRFV